MKNSDEKKYSIEVKNLSHAYGNERVLKEVNFSVEKPLIYGLLGRNGAGKTTLLSLISSFKKVQSGDLYVNGQAPYENEVIMESVSYHGKSDYEEEDEKVIDFLKFYQRYRPHFHLNSAVQMAEMLEVPLEKKVNKLSAGKQSALNAVLGLASRTPITIFDEVYLGMDAPSRVMFYEMILKEQAEFPRIIFLSSHLILEMEYLFDHLLIIDQGKILLDESVESLSEIAFSVTGEKAKVQEATQGLKVIQKESLGPIQKAVVYDQMSDEKRGLIKSLDLEMGNVGIQDLFIYLTDRRGEHYDEK